MVQLFSEGGWTMYPTAFFGVLAVAAALALAVRPERRFLPLLFSLGGLTLFSGFLGTMWGLTGLVKVAANADPAQREVMLSACATQALNSLLLAGVLVVVALLGASSGALRVAMRRPPATAA